MLDNEDGKLEIVANFFDESSQLICFLRIHSGCRLIKKQQLRICCKRARNFKVALLSVRKRGGLFIHNVVKAEDFEELKALLPHLFFFLCVELERCGEKVAFSSHMLCNEHVFKHRH